MILNNKLLRNDDVIENLLYKHIFYKKSLNLEKFISADEK